MGIRITSRHGTAIADDLIINQEYSVFRTPAGLRGFWWRRASRSRGRRPDRKTNMLVVAESHDFLACDAWDCSTSAPRPPILPPTLQIMDAPRHTI